MPSVITIVVQALLLGSWVNALFQEGFHLVHKYEKYSFTCPKLFEGFCTSSNEHFPIDIQLEEYNYSSTIMVNHCEFCYDGCTQYFDGRYNCSECKPGRWGPWCQYSCIPCSECDYWPCDELCIRCNNTAACANSECPDRCTIGFYGPRKRNACTELCGDCRGKQCHKCIYGYYIYVQNGKQICKYCPTGSISCRLDTFHNNAIQAISCDTGYYLHGQDGLTRCKGCPDGCQSCRLYTFNIVQCTSCDIGYYLDVSTKIGTVGCSKCPLGYEECKLNTLYNNTIQCIRSAIGFYLNASNQDQMVECSKCPDHCISCKLETIHSETTINCTSCLKGYYLYTPKQEFGQRCVECPVPCATCIFDTYSYWNNEPLCTSCAQGYYFNYKNYRFNQCTQCPNGCRACGLLDFNAKIPNCTKCEDGFSFQIKNGMGEYVINSSRLDVSAEFIVTFLSIVTVFIVAIGVACFKKRGDKRSLSVAEETKGPERSIGRSKDDGEWLPLGEKMYFNPKRVIGNGSKAVVYEGRYGQAKIKKIAVKAIRCTDHEEAEEYNSEIHKIYRENREMKMIVALIDPSRHPNIVDFIDSFIDNERLYIAFELGEGTLVDYVKVAKALWRETLKCSDVNRGISEGLGYVHEKGIVHRDLKPANVFIVARCDNLKAVIGDFGTAKPTAVGSMFSLTGSMGSSGYIAPEIHTLLSQDASKVLESQCNKKSDIFSAAILFYYTLSLGDNPFGHERTAQESIQNGKIPLYNKIKSIRNSYAHQLLIQSMLKPKPQERPTAVEVCAHPANWTEYKIMEYFELKSDEFEIEVKIDPLKAAILEDPGLIPTGNWMNELPVNIQTYLKSYKVNTHTRCYLYGGKETNVRALLRAIRNTSSHHLEYPLNVQSELGEYPEGHVDMWLKVCPRLLMHVFKILGPP